MHSPSRKPGHLYPTTGRRFTRSSLLRDLHSFRQNPFEKNCGLARQLTGIALARGLQRCSRIAHCSSLRRRPLPRTLERRNSPWGDDSWIRLRCCMPCAYLERCSCPCNCDNIKKGSDSWPCMYSMQIPVHAASLQKRYSSLDQLLKCDIDHVKELQRT